jgi:hypothetical protein
LIQAASECAAPKWAHFAQVPGINNNLPLAVVLFMEQIDQLPGGITVKVPPWDNKQATVAFLNFDLKIGAHAYTSDSYLIAFCFSAYYAFGEIPDFAN